MANLQFEVRSLYGGAISAELPIGCKDLADIVPVPDNQEVFSDELIKATIIIELLERAEVDDSHAASYIFQDIALSNESTDSEILEVETVNPSDAPNLNAHWPRFLLYGQQSVRPIPDPSAPKEEVHIVMFLLRIPEVTTDISFLAHLPAESYADVHEALQILKKFALRFMGTLKIHDMGLFVN